MVFGDVISRKVKLGAEITILRISVLRVLRSDNPEIIKVDLDPTTALGISF